MSSNKIVVECNGRVHNPDMQPFPCQAEDIGPDRPFRLDGRICLVTGGTRGVGAAIARDFALAGASVFLTGRDGKHADAVAETICRDGGRATGLAYDAREADGVSALISRIREQAGRLDVLVNNAAILKPHRIARISEEEFDDLFRVNVKSALFLCKAAHPLMAPVSGAAVVNITAAGGHRPMAGIGVYSATKAAMLNLTRTLAKEWAADGIRVNALTPGSVATEMILPADPSEREAFVGEMASLNLMNRIADPAEIARAARFLASPASSFMTGQTLIVDGGLLA